MTEPHEPAAPAPERRSRAPAVLGALLALFGLVWLLVAVDAVPFSAQVGVGALLVLVGLALALLPEGSHHALLVTAGIVLALLGAGVSALNLDLVEASVGERRETPITLLDLEHGYSLGIGSLGVDLTRIETDVEPEGAVPLRATIGIGELVVAVPREAALHVDAHVALGELDVRGRRRSGFDVRLRTEDEGEDGAPAFRLQLEGGIGSIRVVDDDLGELGAAR